MNAGEGLLWATVALAGLASAVFVIALGFAWDTWRRARERKELAERMRVETKASGRAERRTDLVRETVRASVLETLGSRLPRAGQLELLLHQADVGWDVGRFAVLTVGSTLAFAFLGILVVGIPMVALAMAGFGAMGPYLWVRRKKAKRIDAFEEIFPEAIDLLGRSIRAGHAVSTGFQMVAEEIGEPVATEFRIVFEQQRYGLPVEESLLDLVGRIDSMDVKIFVTAILIQRDVGGNLAEILDNISRTIRERFTIQRQVRVYTAQGRMTGYLLALLPIALGAIIFAMSPEYMSVLFVEPVGRLLIGAAVVLQITGYLIIRRIVTIEV